MNRGWQRFRILFPTALLVVTQLQPAFAGFGSGRFQTASRPRDVTNTGKADATGNQPSPIVSLQQPATREQEKLLASSNEKSATDLTGTWAYERIGSQCTVNKCALATFSLPSLTVNDKKGKVTGEINITQRGNQISIPDRKYVWKGGKYTLRYSGGKISGNTVTLTETAVDTSMGWGYTNSYTGTLSADGKTVEGEVVYTPSTGNNTTKTSFIWRRKRPLAQCPQFETMLSEAKELQELADKLEKDDKAYNAAVIDIVRKGYNSPYALYMLDVPSEEIPELFKDNQQVRAVRSQIISHIRTKADNRKQFADIGINGQFRPQTPVYSKENIELFCTLDSSKFTKEFWDSLWMAGYIDYPLYTETEKKLIVFGYKDWFETLDKAVDLLNDVDGVYILKTGARLLLTMLEGKIVKQLKAKTLSKVTIAEETSVLSKYSRNLNIENIQLQSKFKHAKDFGIEGNWNSQNAERFRQALENYVKNPETQQIVGTFKGEAVIHYVNPKTGLEVITDRLGNFISGWKLNDEQLRNVLTRGSL